MKPRVSWSSVPAGSWMRRHELLGVVVHHARERLAAQAPVEHADAGAGRRPRSGPRPACPGPRPAPRAAPSRPRRRRVMPRASHWRGSLTSTACSTCSWLSTERGRELGDAVGQELEDVLVLVEGEVVAGEAGLQHAEVGAQHARVHAVDGQRPLEAPHGLGHAAQRVARHVGLDALGHEVVQQAAHQLLHAERQAQGVEASARCSCRRWRGCRRRCGASGRCSPWPRRGRA